MKIPWHRHSVNEGKLALLLVLPPRALQVEVRCPAAVATSMSRRSRACPAARPSATRICKSAHEVLAANFDLRTRAPYLANLNAAALVAFRKAGLELDFEFEQIGQSGTSSRASRLGRVSSSSLASFCCICPSCCFNSSTRSRRSSGFAWSCARVAGVLPGGSSLA